MPRAITIGSFDGVHLGHTELVTAARSAVGEQGKVLALSFDPHPLCVLQRANAPKRLSNFQQRREWLTEVGADEVVPLRPTSKFLNQSPQGFLARLVQQYHPSVIVEGADFRFGHERAGSAQTIQQFQQTHGYQAIIIDDVQATLTDHTLVRVSSSLVRWLVQHGRVSDAAIVLGRPYELRGEVLCGDRRGGEALGVPTANLDHGDYLLPADGVYAGRAAGPDGKTYAAAISVGTKPTFGEHPRLCEAHLIGYQGRPCEYGWTMCLQFDQWLRDQIAYERVELLIDQLLRDIQRARESSVEAQGFGVARKQVSRVLKLSRG